MLSPPEIIREERIERQRLILADCLPLLPLLGRFDGVVSDPPYGIGAALTRGGKTGHYGGLQDGGSEEWDFAPTRETFETLRAISKDQIFWGGNYFDLPPTRKPLCWNKLRPNQKNASEWEMAWTSLSGRAQMFDFSANGGFVKTTPSVHPTQKPIELMKWCLAFLPSAVTILDPYMGSGTTLVACEQMGRAGTGIERSEKHFEAACARVREAAGEVVAGFRETKRQGVLI